MKERDGHLLRIFIGEADRHEGKPLYQWIVLKAREMELSGATVLRGVMGFGGSSRIHAASVLRLSEDLPVVVEIVDVEEKLHTFLDVIDHTITEGMATIEPVRIHFYRARS
jgi:PII-like signaling protein